MPPIKKQKPKHVAHAKNSGETWQAKGAPAPPSAASDIERRRNRLARKANARFLRSGIEIQDVYGSLD
jgi:hypothetical protein